MNLKDIGWIGTGVMGNSMCKHILDQGFKVSVYNRTRHKADGLLKKGAQWCESPAEVARNSDCVFTIVGYPADVEEVILGGKGILAGARPGSILVEITAFMPLPGYRSSQVESQGSQRIEGKNVLRLILNTPSQRKKIKREPGSVNSQCNAV